MDKDELKNKLMKEINTYISIMSNTDSQETRRAIYFQAVGVLEFCSTINLISFEEYLELHDSL